MSEYRADANSLWYEFDTKVATNVYRVYIDPDAAYRQEGPGGSLCLKALTTRNVR